MRRRNFLHGALLAGNAARLNAADLCGCSLAPQAASPDPFERVSSGVKITGVKVSGVSLTPESDQPYVFVKIETNKGVIGWEKARSRARPAP